MKKIVAIPIFAFVCILLGNPAWAAFKIKAGSESSSGCGSLVRLHVEPAWEKLDQSPTSSILNQVFFLNKDTGFVSGYDGTLLRTYDGGHNWETISTLFNGQAQPFPLTTLTFNTPKRGFALSNGGDFYTTWDGGDHWKRIESAPHSTLKRLCFVNDKIGFALNSSGHVLKTTDGGDNWVVNYTPVGTTGLYLDFPTVDTGYIANYNGFLAKTTDGGLTWIKVGNNLPTVSNSLYSFKFTNSKTGYWGCNLGLFKTTDGGTTWNLVLIPGKGILSNIRFFGDSLGYVLGKNGCFMKTMDAGNTWYSQNDFGTNMLFDLCFPSPTVGYLVGANGNIFKCTARNIDSCRWEPATALDNPNLRYPLANPSSSKTYQVTAYLNGESTTDQIQIDTTVLTLDLGANAAMVPGATRAIYPKHNYIGTLPLHYKWSPSTGLSSDTVPVPIMTMKDPITYWLTITTPGGCTATDTVRYENTGLSITMGGEFWGYSGDSVLLYNTTNYNGGKPLRYHWVPSTGLSCDSIARPMAKVSNIVYTLTVSTQDGRQSASATAIIRQVSPAAPELCMVTVDNHMKNTLYWNNYSTLIDHYNIYKESNLTNVYTKIGQVCAKLLCTFTDSASNATVQSYKYKISASDRSGTESLLSNAHKTLHLTINRGVGKIWNLIWQPYEGFTVQSYEIYRGTTPDSLVLIGTCSGSNTAWTDLNAPSGSIYYQMAILSPNVYVPNTTLNAMIKLRSDDATQANMVPIATRIKSNLAMNQEVGLKGDIAVGDLFFYTDPNQDWIRIGNQLTEGSMATVRLYDLTGHQVKNQIIDSSRESISISDLRPGMYLIDMQTGKNIRKGKLLVR